MSKDIGIDLGTSTVLISVGGREINLREPSVVAVRRDTGRIISIGEEARRIIGRCPADVVAVKPLRDGVISQYELAQRMLEYFLRKVTGTQIVKYPRVVICIPGDITEVEEKAVLDAATGAGWKNTVLIEETVAAAIGAGLDITMPNGNLVVDIGGGTTDIAVISLSGVITSKSIKVGGDKFDEAIVRYVRSKYNVIIGEPTAEMIKCTIGTLVPEDVRFRGKYLDVKGKKATDGLPCVIRVEPEDVTNALTESVTQILDAISEVIENTPAELTGDIIGNGILMTGGGARLDGFRQAVLDNIGVTVRIPKDPDRCVALGAGKAISFLKGSSGGRNTQKYYPR